MDHIDNNHLKQLNNSLLTANKKRTHAPKSINNTMEFSVMNHQNHQDAMRCCIKIEIVYLMSVCVILCDVIVLTNQNEIV